MLSHAITLLLFLMLISHSVWMGFFCEGTITLADNIYFGGKVVYFSYQSYVRCFAQSSAFSSFSVVSHKIVLYEFARNA